MQNDQRVFHWRCTVYKSVAEEVSVWGSPLRTSGLLPATLSARHLTLLSGEITEVTELPRSSPFFAQTIRSLSASCVSHLLAVVRRKGVADGAGEQRQLLGLPEAERGGGAAGAGDLGAGVPEELAVRGHASPTGRRGAARVQVLDDGAAGAPKAAGKASPFRWRADEPDLTRAGRRSICLLGCF